MKGLDMQFAMCKKCGAAVLASCALSFFPCVSFSETLDESLFAYKAVFTVAGYGGESELAGFPVLVRVSGADIPGFAYEDTAADGIGIQFADESGNILPHEIDEWNPDGESFVWVCLPSLFDGARFSMYWGVNAAEAGSPGSVWADGGYFGVWHLNSQEDGAVPDSSVSGFDGTRLSGSVSTNGLVGGGVLISSGAAGDKNSNCGVVIPNYDSAGAGNTFTFSAWILYKSGQTAGYDRIASRKSSYDAKNGWEVTLRNGDNTALDHRGSSSDPQQSKVFGNVADGEWKHIAVVYEGAVSRVYVNGEFKSEKGIAAASDNGQNLVLGNNNSRNEVVFKGVLDESRLRLGAASADWAYAEYATIADPEFLSCGGAESVDARVPFIASPEVLSVRYHSAELGYTLKRVGDSVPEVRLEYGTERGVYTESVVLSEAVQTTGTFSAPVEGLICNTTYYARIVAENSFGRSETAEFTFSTPGAPVAGEASIKVDGNTAELFFTVLDEGVSSCVTELWFGTDPEALDLSGSWPSEGVMPQTVSKVISGLPYGTYIAKFRVWNVCEGRTNETWAAAVSDTIFGETRWTGAAGDSAWSNPGNWSSGTVPGFKDTAVIGDTGVTDGQVFVLGGSCRVSTLVIETSKGFTIGDAELDADNELGITDLIRRDVDGTEKDQWFRAPVSLYGDDGGECSWEVSGSGRLYMDAQLRTGDSVSPTFVKTGGGTFTMYYTSPAYRGPWKVLAGTLEADGEEGEPNSLAGKIEVGGGEETATLNNVGGRGGLSAMFGESTVTVKTNGVFVMRGPTSGKVSSVRAEEGGLVRDVSSWCYTYKVYLKGGKITGGRFSVGGWQQTITTYASEVTAIMDCGFNTGKYYETYVNVEDGTSPVDLLMTKSIYSDGMKSKICYRRGAGTAVFTEASTMGNTSSTNQVGWKIEAGRSIFDNESGSAVGRNPTSVSGDAIIGGSGFFGGDAANDNFSVTLAGSSAEKTARIQPGSVDFDTGESLVGTMTVGSEAKPNAVVFGKYSGLDCQIGSDGTGDCLDVFGTVDLSAGNSELTVTVDPDAKPGEYTLLRASDGITGMFDGVKVTPETYGKPEVSGIEIVFVIPYPGSMIIIK